MFPQLDVSRKISSFLARLPRNLRCNRFYVLSGRNVFFYSPARSHRWKMEHAASPRHIDPGQFRVYRKVSISRARFVQGIDQAFLIPHLGRFGNAVREVVSALAAAQELGIGHIFLHGDTVFSAGSDVPRPGVHASPSQARVWIDQPVSPLFGKIQELVSWSRGHLTVSRLNADGAWNSMGQIIERSLPAVSGSSSNDSLVIHLRGGDVFGPRSTPEYGQPPLAFFQLVLSQRNWRTVTIVHQDHANPVLQPLIDYCESSGLVVETQSGSLEEDIAVMMKASALVAGRGTFIPAIAGLSRELRDVFFFEDKFVLDPPRTGLSIWQVTDVDGKYVRSVLGSVWANTPDQREMMVAYPMTSLAISAAVES